MRYSERSARCSGKLYDKSKYFCGVLCAVRSRNENFDANLRRSWAFSGLNGTAEACCGADVTATMSLVFDFTNTQHPKQTIKIKSISEFYCEYDQKYAFSSTSYVPTANHYWHKHTNIDESIKTCLCWDICCRKSFTMTVYICNIYALSFLFSSVNLRDAAVVTRDGKVVVAPNSTHYKRQRCVYTMRSLERQHTSQSHV